MIHPKELITENILYSCSWEYSYYKHNLYLTKDKLYEYIYDKKENIYAYKIFGVKNFGNIHVNCSPFMEDTSGGLITITNRDNNVVLASFRFSCSEEGNKILEELFIAILKVMN